MKKNRKPLVGEILYSLNVGNSARGCEQKLTKVTVSSSGRKYFKTKEDNSDWETEYHIDGWYEKTEYISNTCLYESPQEWEDEKEEKQILNYIYKGFEHGYNRLDIDLETLKKIKSLMSKE